MSFPTYRGFPVLDWQPDWRDPSRTMTFTQAKNRLSADGPGPLMDDAPWQPRPRTSFRYRFVLETRADMNDARDFLRDTAQGRRNAFWIPLWSQAVHLAAEVGDTDTALVVTRSRYTTLYAGEGRGREHLAILPADGRTPICRKITASEELDETTEQLTLDSTPGLVLPVGSFVAFLLYARMDTDAPVLQWLSFSAGVLEIPVVDLPVMTP